ncbi:MAG: hypothetical protein AB8G15_21320 [Saprospiraceae bacterium]
MWLKSGLFLIVLVCGFVACRDTAPKQLSTAPTLEIKKLKPAGIKVWIYDFNPSKKSFQYEQVDTGITSGDPIRVAIRYFLDNNHLNKSFRGISLVRIGMQNQKAAFIFSGRIESQNEKKDLATFKMALDSTIRKNNFRTDYSIVLNDMVL